MAIQLKNTTDHFSTITGIGIGEKTPVLEKPATPSSPTSASSVNKKEAAEALQEEEQIAPPENGAMMRGVDNVIRFVTRFRRRIGIIFGSGAVIYLAVILFYTFYEGWLLGAADKALAEYQYKAAERHYGRYLAMQPADYEARYQLAKALIYTGQYEKAESILDALSLSEGEASPEMLFYHALSVAKQKNEEKMIKLLNEAFHVDETYFPAHYLYNLMFIFIKPNYSLVNTKSAELLEKVAVLDDDADIALGHSEEIHHARRVLIELFPTRFRSTLPLPFSGLQEEILINEVVGLKLSPKEFNNTYYVPMHDMRLFDQRMSAKEGVVLMQAVAALMVGEPETARTQLRQLEGSEALLYYYMQGYLSVLDNDYESAVKFYQSALQAGGESADGIVLHANAKWVGSGGAKPTEENIDGYKKALSLEKDNVIAINNLAFLHTYLGNMEEARRLLESSGGVGILNKYISTNLALLRVDRNNFKKAAAELKALFRNYPDLPIVVESLLRALKIQGENTEAITLLKEWRKKYSEHDTPEVALEIASLYREHSQPLLVIAELSDAAEKFPDNRDITAEILLEYVRQQRIDSFREVLASVKSDEDFMHDPRVLVARAYTTQNAYARRALFEEAVTNADTIDKKNKALTGWARWLLDNGEDMASESLLMWAAKVNGSKLPPLSLQAALMRLQALDAQGDAEQTAILREAETFIAGHLDLAISALLDVAWVFIHLGKPDRAIDLASNLNYSASGTTDVLNVLRVAYLEIGNTEKVDEIDRRIALIKEHAEEPKDSIEDPVEYLDVIVGEGSVDNVIEDLNKALRENDYQTAISMYTKIIDLKIKMETPALTYQNRGALYVRLNEYELAVKDFQKALSLGENLTDKQREPILYNYGYALLRLGRYKQSVEVLESVIKISPENVEVLSLYASVLEKSRAYDSLVNVYQKIIALSPGQMNAYQSMAHVYSVLGRQDDAIQTLNKALEIEPRNREIHRSLAEVYALKGESIKAQEHLDILKSI